MIGRSWLEVDLEGLRRNWRSLTESLDPSLMPMAVVKANAYGHGDIQAAKTLQALGCGHFAVSNMEEAIRLRDSGVSGQLLILGYTPPDRREELLKYDITQALLSEDYAIALGGQGIKAQFAIDTGMNRIGLNGEDPEGCEKIIRRWAKSYRLTGLFTHLCVADTESENAFTDQQIACFRGIAERVADLHLPYIHCMNSAGSLYHKPYGNLARLGVVLYGMKPDPACVLPEDVKPFLCWKTVVSMVKTVHPGESVGYGRAYRAEQERRVATLPTGYGDGYSRLYGKEGYVMIRGQKAPILGRVCMDQMMVDVTGIPGVQPGDIAELMGNQIPPDEHAGWMGTINYEVTCMIGSRVPRVYLHKV